MTPTDWNFADVWEAVAEVHPERLAVTQGDRSYDWRRFDARAAHPPAEADLIETVRRHLAGYKAPRHVVIVETIGRAPNGKVDYKRLKAEAIARIGSSDVSSRA